MELDKLKKEDLRRKKLMHDGLLVCGSTSSFGGNLKLFLHSNSKPFTIFIFCLLILKAFLFLLWVLMFSYSLYFFNQSSDYSLQYWMLIQSLLGILSSSFSLIYIRDIFDYVTCQFLIDIINFLLTVLGTSIVFQHKNSGHKSLVDVALWYITYYWILFIFNTFILPSTLIYFFQNDIQQYDEDISDEDDEEFSNLIPSSNHIDLRKYREVLRFTHNELEP